MLQIIALVTGTEIIAEVEEQPADYLKLSMPALMGLLPQGGMGIMEFAPFVKDEAICIPLSQVLYRATPKDEVTNIYNERFGNGILTPNKGILVP